MGIPKVYSFHMTLSYSRDPFCCFTTSQDLQTFFDCHRRAFAHFGGVPMTIVYDRTKTVVRRHVAPGEAVPLHPEAIAFAGHYGFDIDVLAAYWPTGKGRVERQVLIVRDHVLAGRSFSSLQEMDAAFTAWTRCDGQRCTAPTARSSECGPSVTTWPCGRCWRRPMWSRSGPRSPRSCCTPPSPTPAARRCWPSIRGLLAAAPASSTRPTGRAYPRATTAASPPAICRPSPVTSTRQVRSPALCRPC
nr:DDE-type integrase/transposase/recombinase [Streptomyces sp. C1-2]